MKTSVLVCLLALFVGLTVFGCGSLYKAMGLPPEQVEAEVEKDSAVILTTVQQARDTFWPILSAAIGATGTLLTAVLGRLLSTERKLTGSLVAGVKKAGNGDALTAVTTESLKRGVGVQLATRLRKAR